MKTSSNRMFLGSAALVLAMLMLTVQSRWTSASAQADGRVIWGTWVLAMDTAVFGLPGGVFPALATFHRDGTVIVSDGGDLGSAPFTTSDTPQHGVWLQTGQQTFEATTLFFRRDDVTGEGEGWHRGRFVLQFGADGDHLAGHVEEEVLPCNPGPTPFTLLNCPDPITSAFIPAPFPIPIELTRLHVH